jgi:hypothetical protein
MVDWDGSRVKVVLAAVACVAAASARVSAVAAALFMGFPRAVEVSRRW